MALAVGALVLVAVVALALAIVSHQRAQRAAALLRSTTELDALTGLPNEVAAEVLIANARRRPPRDRTVGLVVLGLDRYDLVNQNYGPEVGDSLLRSMTEVLSRALEAPEQLARLRGPRFLVLTTATDGPSLRSRAIELCTAASVPHQLGHDRLQVGVSVGAVLDNREGRDPASLVSDGLLAMRNADGPAGRGEHVALFETTMRAGAGEANSERRLREALDNEQFTLYWVPVVDLATDGVVGVEAELRWIDPKRGLIGPDEFVGELEQSGLTVPLGRWLIEQACQQTREWNERFPGVDLITTVDLTARQLAQPELPDWIIGAVESTGLNPGRLCLQISETAAGQDIDDLWYALRPVKEIGVQLGLGEFGVGHSSLGYLRRFPLDVVKIDASFVHRLGTSRSDATIVEQVVSMAHALEITAVAEGVQSASQADELRSLRCEYAQGPWWTPPQPAAAIEEALATGRIKPGQVV